MLQAIIALYFLTVLIGATVGLLRVVQRDLSLIGAALAYRRPAREHTTLPVAAYAR